MAVFAKLRKRIKGLIHKVQGNTSIIEALGVNPQTSSAMRDAICTWTKMYENKPDWIRKGNNDNPIDVVSLGIPAAIASEKARMATLELKSVITSKVDSKRAEFLNKNYQDGIIAEIRKQAEYAIAKGSLVITPYPVYAVDENGNEKLHHFAFDFTQADRFIPISFDSSGNLVDCAFLMRKETQEYIYYRLERQTYENGTLLITNRAFRRSARSAAVNWKDIYDTILGDEISLTSVPEWESIEPEHEYGGIEGTFFALLKMPHANTIDPDSSLGVSGYSRAVDLIRQADEQHGRLEWEYQANLARIDIDQYAVKDKEGNNLDGIDRIPAIFRMRDTNDYTSYEVYAPAMRTSAYIEGMDEILTHIEYQCGMSYGTLVPRNGGQSRTAYELKMMRERSFSENASIQEAIQKALEKVVYIMDVYYTLCTGETPAEDHYQVSFEWDDSIIVDRDTELQQRLTLMHDDILGRIEIRMWYFGETEEQAIAALQKIDEERKKITAGKLDDIGVA